MVVGEEPLEEEHRQEAPQDPIHRRVQGASVMGGMGQKMEQGDAEHQPRHKADRRLQARMGRVHCQQEPSARQGRQQYQDAIDAQHYRGG
jgi:hypothetical protein